MLTLPRRLRRIAALAACVVLGASNPFPVSATTALSKLDPLLQLRVSLTGHSQAIVTAPDLLSLSTLLGTVRLLGGTVLRQLPIIDGALIDMPNALWTTLAANPLVVHLAYNRTVAGAWERTGQTIGATDVRADYGYDGSGVGVAVIDSGVTTWHDYLAAADGSGQRVEAFVDFVNGASSAYDDYGHGTHVAGIIAGNGTDSAGGRTGIAPGAHLVVLKVLDGLGQGRISNVIAALDYVAAHASALNIRVVNLSVATGVYESYNVDPLTLAARNLVASGIVVVAAAGNYGRGPGGTTAYAGITAPGNAPWVLTVGASSHMGTVDRSDDTIAAFSSRGPTAVDALAKPDLVAPGVGIESLSSQGSWLSTAYPQAMLPGTSTAPPLPYMSLSGTSMAAPVVTGTVALLLQANPSLTPNLVKAVLEYSAQVYPAYDPLTEGAGFLNAKGAVDLARTLASGQIPGAPDASWSGRFMWGNQLVTDGRIMAASDAWLSNVPWGAQATPSGQRIVWGVTCSSLFCDPGNTATWTPWEGPCVGLLCGLVDSATSYPNVVWGQICGGADCGMPWSTSFIAASSDGGDTIVWGTSDGGDTVVWGTSDGGDTVVWGTSCSDPSCTPTVWGGQ